jgi:hypothetical protein
VTYSGMACGHTTIGAERFHFRVRNGIGWYPLAIAARLFGEVFVSTLVAFADARIDLHRSIRSSALMHRPRSAKRLGCYMVKPHGQLVPVSSVHYCTYTPGLSTT